MWRQPFNPARPEAERKPNRRPGADGNSVPHADDLPEVEVQEAIPFTREGCGCMLGDTSSFTGGNLRTAKRVLQPPELLTGDCDAVVPRTKGKAAAAFFHDG